MTLRGLRGNLMGIIVDVKLRAVGSYHFLGNGSGDLLDGATPGRSKIERKSFSTLQRLRTKPWDMCNTFDSEISRPPRAQEDISNGEADTREGSQPGDILGSERFVRILATR